MGGTTDNTTLPGQSQTMLSDANKQKKKKIKMKKTIASTLHSALNDVVIKGLSYIECIRLEIDPFLGAKVEPSPARDNASNRRC